VKTPTCSIDALMPGREVGVNQRGITCSTLQVSLRGGKTLATPKSGGLVRFERTTARLNRSAGS
jgi:hypothetical protein